MDIPRPENKKRKRIRQLAIGGGTALLLVAVTVGLSRLEPAAPSVDRDTQYIDTCSRGEMLRQVRGPGTLVLRDIRWIGAQSAGRVDRVIVRAGAVVEPDTILVQLSNPDLMSEAEKAGYALEAAKAEQAELELTLRSQELDQRAALAQASAQFEGARLQAEAEREAGVVAELTVRRSELQAEQYKATFDIQTERLAQFGATVKAQLDARPRASRAAAERSRPIESASRSAVRARRSRRRGDASSGRGRRSSFSPARTSRASRGPTICKPSCACRRRRPRTSSSASSSRSIRATASSTAKSFASTRPCVEGTVQVDVELMGKLPRGARPDQSVDGTIEIERLADVIYMGRPAYGQPNSTICLFKLVDDGDYAVRVPVELGRTSVNSVEIVQGLRARRRGHPVRHLGLG